MAKIKAQKRTIQIRAKGKFDEAVKRTAVFLIEFQRALHAVPEVSWTHSRHQGVL
ncbi:hypothetical protein [Denitrobaculum tricleocarpae]|uniref:hypothetical protein n=1 Tax=Denitrobaculum tricleocarpae TaxID=2591009 RepID=UPI0015D2552D|nr:hypothetical protein [Denitrobaculum tricleocarpae]